jgi:type IV pilus assembly protein PilX
MKRFSPLRQRGAILITSLLLLLVLTIIGVTAMQMSRMQERMAGNSRDLSLAFQGSEAALRDAEELVFTQGFRPETCNTPPCVFWSAGAVGAPERLTTDWWNSNAVEFQSGAASRGASDLEDLSEDPEFVVEWMGHVKGVGDSLTSGHGLPEGRDFYRITAHSTGGSGTANTVLQTTYAKKF